MRAIAICGVLAACGRADVAAPAGAPVAAPTIADAHVAPAGPVAVSQAPGARLPDGVAPIAYDLTLELDPDRATFTGRVAITIAVTAPTTQLWLHAAELELGPARLTVGGHSEPVTVLAGDAAAQLRGFALPRPVGGPGGETVVLSIEYTGHVGDLSRRYGKDEEGLFRERTGGHWYLYSQAESVFARKIVPCFDEPRWKPAWRVTAIVPRGQVALANAPLAAQRTLPGGRRELRFAEIAGLPSYLLAIAVGPFELVDAGALGRRHVPARIAVAQGDGAKVGRALHELPRIVDALERYLDAPLPLAKLDLVAVPQFFGAMENPGLITYEHSVLVGGRELVLITAHELAHQWFGNAVTPIWWEHLWLSEAFASWLGERIAGELGAVVPPVVAHRARAAALAADDRPGARPLVHPIATSDEVEPMFDTLAYDKGAAVVAMFEQLAGDAAFRAAVRGYLTAHAGTSVASPAFLAALGAATSPALGAALGANLAHAGTPVIELALRCDRAPAIVAAVRDGVALPVCVRFPAAATAPTATAPTAKAPATTTACLLAGAHTEYALPAGCPTWVVGNAGGRGYYRTLWQGREPVPPLAQLTPAERLARGDDLALAVRHGELPIAAALAELTTLAASHDAYGALAALAIAHAIDPLISDPVRPAWAAWLAGRFADRLTAAMLGGPSGPLDDAVRDALVDLVRGAISPATLAQVRAAADRRSDPGLDMQLRVDSARDPSALFDRVVDAAADATATSAMRGDLLEALGAFPARFAPRVVDVVLDARFAPAQVWPALAAMLARGESRTAAWQAIHARSAAVLGALTAQAREVAAATATLCRAAARGEVAADFATARSRDRAVDQAVSQALAEIDRCIARRAAAGDLGRALAPAGAGSTPPR